MSGPVAYDVPMDAIACFCLDQVARLLGLPVSELRPIDFDVVRFPDGRHAGRVTLAAAPLPAAEFEPAGGR